VLEVPTIPVVFLQDTDFSREGSHNQSLCDNPGNSCKILSRNDDRPTIKDKLLWFHNSVVHLVQSGQHFPTYRVGCVCIRKIH